ncbi:hypothetical protein BJ878DRAFT_97098 [Calycina marina]|uniref:Uncharacterized protein n=1 Tax=Calycina marina TaxID=1763456 RepID=A0A9P8CEM7_9HELO|nr:hypothetical protein BJ878DRAFT_97098 [Calycina marina]
MMFVNTVFFAAAALASLVSATNTVEFVNQDDTIRHIVFTGQSGMSELADITIEGKGTATQSFSTGWIGNWYSYNDGQYSDFGMLGEVRFDGSDGLVYFDVSALINSTDTEGVKMMYPNDQNPSASSSTVSGCQTSPCENQYNEWDDVATKATNNSDLVCLIGNVATTTRRGAARLYSRDFVTGESS